MSDSTMTEVQTGTDVGTESTGGCGCGGCGCGGGGGGEQSGLQIVAKPDANEVQAGDLDVRTLPPAQRHEQIFAAVAALVPGEGFVLANDHDPKPLKYQLDAEQPGEIGWEYLAEGPDVWRVLISRTTCC